MSFDQQSRFTKGSFGGMSLPIVNTHTQPFNGSLSRTTRVNKAIGPHEVPAELFKAGGETVLDRIHRICVAIWETGEWPEEWTFSTFIPLPKKGDLKQCANCRTIALVFLRKQDPSSDHTGEDPSKDRNGNCR